jgi:flagellar motor switch protein FliM
VRALDALHRRYAERASGTLTAMVRGRAQVTLTEIRQCSYFDFIRSLHNPTSLQLVYCVPGKQPFVAEMTPAILFPILDRLLGSEGDDSPFPIRPFTSIEAPLVSMVFQRLLDDLATSWSTGEADETASERTTPHIRFDIRESEHNPMLMQVFGPSEPTVVIEFQLTLDSSSGPLHVCLPTKPFESMIGALVEASTLCPKALTGEDERRDAVRKRLEACDLTLAAELAPVPIALEDLVRLRPGDILDTELSHTSDVSVRIEGQDVFRGRVVTHKGRRAMLVTGFCREDSILGEEARGQESSGNN